MRTVRERTHASITFRAVLLTGLFLFGGLLVGCQPPAESTPLNSSETGLDVGSAPLLDGSLQDSGAFETDGAVRPDSDQADLGREDATPVDRPDAHVADSMVGMDAASPSAPDLGSGPPAEDDAAIEPPPPGMPCPIDWETRRLAVIDDGRWEARDTTEGVQSLTEGTCGGGSGQHIYPFTAPAAGNYAVAVSGDTFSPLGFAVVYVRSSCPESDTELGCDARRESNAATSIQLFADQSVYIFVDGIRGERFPSTGGYHLQVFRTESPALRGTMAWMNRSTGSTSVEVEGVVGSGSVGGIEYRFLDPQGQAIPSRGRVEPQRFGMMFELADEADERVSFAGTLDFNAELEADQIDTVTHLEVAVYDELAGVSEPNRVPLQQPTPLDLWAHCDPVGARSVCPDATACFIQDPLVDPQPACHPTGRDCPAAWTVLDLNGLEVGEERWVYEGSLLRGEPPLERHGQGTCPGSTGFNDLFSFVAPRMGTYVIETQGDIGDTILWARTECGINGAAAELACNDDGPGRGRFSQVSVNLERQQRIYVFVDSFGVGNRGPYTLTVRRN